MVKHSFWLEQFKKLTDDTRLPFEQRKKRELGEKRELQAARGFGYHRNSTMNNKQSKKLLQPGPFLPDALPGPLGTL